jgi:hypothetical protein
LLFCGNVFIKKSAQFFFWFSGKKSRREKKTREKRVVKYKFILSKEVYVLCARCVYVLFSLWRDTPMGGCVFVFSGYIWLHETFGTKSQARRDIWLSFNVKKKFMLVFNFFQRLHTVEIECTIFSGLFITIVQASGSVMFFALRWRSLKMGF